jgi:galactokinase
LPDRVVAFGPGRVNLIGEHTDYNDGLAMPFAIERGVTVTATPAQRWLVDALDFREHDEFSKPKRVRGWKNFHRGMIAELQAAGYELRPAQLVLTGDLPRGSGLSSSAALEVAVALALGGGDLSPVDLAFACQKAEHLATGVPSGVMDQLASIAGRKRHALRIDCRSLELRHVRIPDDAAVVVVHSGVQRALERSEYAERRAGCERIAAALGLRSLREATLDQVRDEPLGRHVVTENARVEETAAALEAGNLPRVGELMSESHASLRDDYRVSTPKLDALVEQLVSAGAYGARLTGAGFGGCVVGITRLENAPDIARSFPTAWTVEASDGAGPLVLQP